MRGGARGVVCASVLAALCAAADAQVFRWTDERGEIHITEGLENVPERHRGSAELLRGLTPPAPQTRSRGPEPGALGSVASGVATIRFKPGQPIRAIARINGSAIVSLIVDTGAEMTTIHSSAMRALGMDLREAPTQPLIGIGGVRQGRVVMLDRLEVGGAVVAPFPVIVLETGASGQGLLGRDFLRHFSVVMDNQAGVLVLSAR